MHYSLNQRRITVKPNPNLDLWPFNPKTILLVGYLKIIPYSKFEHFEIILFELCSGQTDKQTDHNEVDVGNKVTYQRLLSSYHNRMSQADSTACWTCRDRQPHLCVCMNRLDYCNAILASLPAQIHHCTGYNVHSGQADRTSNSIWPHRHSTLHKYTGYLYSPGHLKQTLFTSASYSLFSGTVIYCYHCMVNKDFHCGQYHSNMQSFHHHDFGLSVVFDANNPDAAQIRPAHLSVRCISICLEQSATMVATHLKHCIIQVSLKNYCFIRYFIDWF